MSWDRWLLVAFMLEVGAALALSRCDHPVPAPASSGPLRCICERAP